MQRFEQVKWEIINNLKMERPGIELATLPFEIMFLYV